MLHDEAVALGGIARIRLGSARGGLRPAPLRVELADNAFRDVPAEAPRVAMMHNPLFYPDIPPGQAPLAVGGHNHRGQIAVLGTPRWSDRSMAYEHREIAVDGWAEVDVYKLATHQPFASRGASHFFRSDI